MIFFIFIFYKLTFYIRIIFKAFYGLPNISKEVFSNIFNAITISVRKFIFELTNAELLKGVKLVTLKILKYFHFHNRAQT